MQKKIGHRLRELIKESQFTQEEFADLLQIDRTGLTYYFNKDDIKISLLKKCASILGVGMQVFFDEAEFYNSKQQDQGLDLNINSVDFTYKLTGLYRSLAASNHIADLSQLSIVICDDQQLVGYANDSFSVYTGYSKEEIYGKKVGDVLRGPHENTEARIRLRFCLKTKQRYSGELLNRDKSGQDLICKLLIEPVPMGDSHIYLGLATFRNR